MISLGIFSFLIDAAHVHFRRRAPKGLQFEIKGIFFAEAFTFSAQVSIFSRWIEEFYPNAYFSMGNDLLAHWNTAFTEKTSYYYYSPVRTKYLSVLSDTAIITGRLIVIINYDLIPLTKTEAILEYVGKHR